MGPQPTLVTDIAMAVVTGHMDLAASVVSL